MTTIEEALEWHRSGKLEHAERAYRELLRGNSRNADAANLLGLICQQRGDYEESASLFKVAVDCFPNNVSYLLNYGSALARLGRPEESREAYNRAIALQPNGSEANAQFGLFLAQMNEFEEAEPFLRRSVELDGEKSAFRVNFGNALKALGKREEANEQLTQAVALDRDNPFAWNSLGELRQLSGQDAEALEAFGKAVELMPNNPKFQANLGLALSGQGRLSEADRALDLALRQDPEDAFFLASRAAALRDSGDIAGSLELFRLALAKKPNDFVVVSKYLYTLNFSTNLSAREIDREHLAINRCFEITRKAQRALCREGGKLKIGFLSGDFRAHSVAYFLLPLLRELDRSRFAVYCYSETTHEDSITDRFKNVCDGWRPIFGKASGSAAAMIESDRIDILIDLSGHTAGGRSDVLAEKPAPMILNWLGYPNKVGLETMDGRIVDAATDPPGPDDKLVEPLFRLKPCFLAYEPPYEIPEIAETPAMKKGCITFGSFNNAAKISEPCIDLWSSVLKRVSDSRLFLKSWQFGDDTIRERFEARFAKRGISKDRLQFNGRTASYDEHLALYGEVDIALDAFPYNGTTTTCEALWMGAPVVTLVGDRHASRVGASLLQAAGEGNCIAFSPDEYAELAAGLAEDVESLAELRSKRRQSVSSSALGDARRFARNFETLLESIVCKGEGDSNHLDVLVAEGVEFHKQGDLAGAIEKYDAALRVDPSRGDASHYCGVARYGMGEFGEAVRLLDRATMEMPERSDVWTHYGSALLEAGRMEEAVEAQEKALELEPSNATILGNYGNSLAKSGRAEEALKVYRRSIDARPGDAPTWCNYASALKACGRLFEAEEAARRSTEIDPAFGGGWSMLGVALVAIGEPDKAVTAFRKAIDGAPHQPWHWSNLIYALQYSDTTRLEMIAAACRGFGEQFGSLPSAVPSQSSEGYRIGIVSSDFREHAVSRFLLPLLREGTRYGFKIIMYSDCPTEDRWTEELRKEADLWRSIVGKSDEGALSLIRQDNLDILIDLAGHSSRNRLSLFARKPAGLQFTWLGFPGSTGLAAMDGRIGDSVAVTDREESLFPERIVRLEDGFHSISLPTDLAVSPLPCESGNPFTFGSFNNLSKASPSTLEQWARILTAAPESRLALKAYQLRDPAMEAKLICAFERLGIGAERLLFLNPVDGYEAHLRSYDQVDVALDTFPYNGTTTTCEALWMGVPVVTLTGDRTSARMGASLLSQIGRREWIVDTAEAYVDCAVGLQEERSTLAAARQSLRSEIERSSLGDGRIFGKRFFAAMQEEIENARSMHAAPSQCGEVDQVLPGDWVEFIDFGKGRRTSGDLRYPDEYEMLPADLKGKRALDLGCIDGRWSVAAARRGANVVAIPAEGFAAIDETGTWQAPREPMFEACRDALELPKEQFRFERKSVYQIGELGEFDWVMWMVNANMVRHPLMAFDSIRSVCREGLCVSVTLCSADNEDAGFPLIRVGGEMPWLPSRSGLAALLEQAEFSVERIELVDAGDGVRIAVARAHPV